MKNLEDLNARAERRDAAENRQRILDAAQKLFELNGAEQVSMNQIAVEAGIGPGTLYRRYRNKSELCYDLKKDNIIQLFEDSDNYLKQHQADPPEQRLKDILRLFICFYDRNIQLLKEIDIGSTDNRTNAIMQSPVYKRMHEIIIKLFNEMTTSDPKEPDNVFRVDMLLYAILKGDSYLFQRDVRGYSPESFLDQLCRTFFPKG